MIISVAGGRGVGGIDDQRAVEPARDVLAQRHHVAVIRKHAKRLGDEVVGEGLACRHHLENAVHVRWMNAVEVDRVRLAAAVLKMDEQPVAGGRAERRAGHEAVVGPGRKFDSFRDFEFLVFGHRRVFPLHRCHPLAGSPSHSQTW